MTRPRTVQLTRHSGPKDTTISLSSGKLIEVWVNRDIFTSDGALKKEQEFTVVDSTSLLSFKWPGDIKLTTVVKWTPKITARLSERKREFAEHTVMELGQNRWEMVKSVMVNCQQKFDAYLLDVSFWGITLGYRTERAARGGGGADNAESVKSALIYLLPDLEYLFCDLTIHWTHSLSHLPGLEGLPVQESLQAVSQELSCPTGPDSHLAYNFTGNSQECKQPERPDADQRNILWEVLSGVQEIRQRMNRLEQEMSKNHWEVCQYLGDRGFHEKPDNPPLSRGRPEDAARPLALRPPEQVQTPAQDSTSHGNARPTERPGPAARTEGARTQDTVPLSSSPQQQRHGRDQTPRSRQQHNGHTAAPNRNSKTENKPAATNDSNKQTRGKAKSMDRTENGGAGNVTLIAQDDNSATRGMSEQSIKQNRKNNDFKQANNLNSGRNEETRPPPVRNAAPNRFQSTRSTSASPSRSSPSSKKFPKSNAPLNNLPSASRPQSPVPRPQAPAQPQSSTASPQPGRHQASKPAPQQTSARNQSPRRPPASQSFKEDAARGARNKSSQQRTFSTPQGSSFSPRHQQEAGKKEDPHQKESFNAGINGLPRSETGHSRSESQDCVKLLVGSSTEGQHLREALEKAYRPDMKNSPKAKSFDTVLCLDISESMREGGAFDEMKKVAREFMSGVEDVVMTFGVEENIGLVTFGGRAHVIQNLTNDFNLILDELEGLKPTGRSPFMEALLVAMAAFVKKGGIVSVSGEWQVKPRIIFISDGRPTESVGNEDEDRPGNIDNVRLSLSNVLMSFRRSESTNKVHPIVFIPVGKKADKKYMKTMSHLCEGLYMEPENVLQLCHYFRVQETIGKVLACMKNQNTELGSKKIDAAMTALTPNLTTAQKEEIRDVIHRELANPNRARSHNTKPNDFSHVYEDTERVRRGTRLPLGTRVVRGPNWTHDDQDKEGPGTVYQHTESHSVHWVHWDHGDYNCYGYSENRGYQICQTRDHPRLRKGNEPLEMGMTVKKSRDWTPAEDVEEEQGEGMGVIIRKTSAKVMVKWANGVIQTCKWSFTGPQEVDYCPPDSDLDNVDRFNKPKSDSMDPSESMSPNFDGEGTWQWCDEKAAWHSYDARINQQLEAACKKSSHRTCLFEKDGKQRRVIFRKMVEKAVNEGHECIVRRLPKQT